MTTCVVCLESIDKSKNNYCISLCEHLFHLDCLLLVTKNNNHPKCPLCSNCLTEPELELKSKEQIDMDIEIEQENNDLDELYYFGNNIDYQDVLNIILLNLHES